MTIKLTPMRMGGPPSISAGQKKSQSWLDVDLPIISTTETMLK
jgi:hypothetical protein